MFKDFAARLPTMSTSNTRWKFLDRKPASHYRQLFVKGRRIAARTLYDDYVDAEDPQSIEEVAANYDLPVAVVAEAIAYCQTNPPEIQEDWRMEQESLEALGRNDPESRWFGRNAGHGKNGTSS